VADLRVRIHREAHRLFASERCHRGLAQAFADDDHGRADRSAYWREAQNLWCYTEFQIAGEGATVLLEIPERRPGSAWAFGGKHVLDLWAVRDEKVHKPAQGRIARPKLGDAGFLFGLRELRQRSEVTDQHGFAPDADNAQRLPAAQKAAHGE
jgi:hypothetical protein